jgi:hypothetical protein
VRSRAKIEATIDNAQALIERGAEYGGFDQYAHSHGDFDNTVRDLKRQFRVIGDSGAYHFLWAVDEPTPLQRDWFKPRDEPRRLQLRGNESTAHISHSRDEPPPGHNVRVERNLRNVGDAPAAGHTCCSCSLRTSHSDGLRRTDGPMRCVRLGSRDAHLC